MTLLKSILTRGKWHFLAVLVMLLTSIIYCNPEISGKVIRQSDIVKSKAQSQEAAEYRESTGDEALWTNHVFSGMTTTNIALRMSGDIIRTIQKSVLKVIPNTTRFLFLSMLGLYIMLLVMGVGPWLALAGALGYGLSSNLLISIVAGHNTKVLSIAYMAPALAGVILAYRKKWIEGGLLAMISVNLMVAANHQQIQYYFLLCASFAGFIYMYKAVRERAIPQFLKTTVILIAAGIIGFLPSAGKTYSVYVHNQETIRGGNSEMKAAQANGSKGSGLDKSYAQRWSYAPVESMTFLVPSAMGGGSGEEAPSGGALEEQLRKYNLNKKQKESVLKQIPGYIGPQPFLLGPVYLGIIFIFLFIFTLFVIRNEVVIWGVVITLFALSLAWGRHFPLNDIWFEILPLFNKFRTPSMALAIAGIAVPMLGIYGLHHALNGKMDQKKLEKALIYSGGITLGLMVLVLFYGMGSDWSGPKDEQLQGSQLWGQQNLYDALRDDRASIFFSDWMIGLFFFLVVAGTLFLTLKKKLSAPIFMAILAVALMADSWRVSKRYLNSDNYVKSRNFERLFQPTEADNIIFADKGLHHRVINLTRDPWTDGHTCYHHQNVGGHHAAKVLRYQDLITHKLSPEIGQIGKGLAQAGNQVMINPEVAKNLTGLNMLNTKYFIVQESPAVVVTNPAACGPAWFVRNIQEVNTAVDEMNTLNAIDPKASAVIRSDQAASLQGYSFGKGPSANIKITQHTPNELIYQSTNSQAGFAVFSEVYYSNGWVATIDGQEAEILKVNYTLRGIKVPAGQHEVKMRFEPDSYVLGNMMSGIGSVLFLLTLVGGFWMYFRQEQRKEALDYVEAKS